MKNILKFETGSGWSMVLGLKFMVIFLLGVSAGMPLAVVLSTIKAFLYEKGMSIELIGLIGLISIAYSIKFLFAPFLDSIKVPFLSNKIGFRKSWIVLLQFIIASSIFLISIVSVSDVATSVIILTCVVAVSSACQDVVIDGYRIELFEKRDQGLAASFYIFGYRFGLLISGAFALYIADIFGWQISFLVICLVIFAILLITLFVFETTEPEIVLFFKS